MKRRFKLSIFVFLLISIVFITVNIISNNSFKVATCELSFDNLPSNFDNYKILQIADLHSMEFGEENCGLIKKINEINPNLIVVSGDMFSASELKKKDRTYDRSYNEESLVAFKLLKKLHKDYKIVYSTGNHEEGIDIIFNDYELSHRDRTVDNAYNRYINKLSKLGIDFVDNTSTRINIDKQHINIYGIYDSSINKFSKKPIHNEAELKFLDSVDKDEFNILLSHNPIGAEILIDKEFDLILSGHVHGGIVRILNKGILDPARKLFPKYDKGLYSVSQSKLYVSVGLGNTKFIRINNKPEINLITLKSR